jgi:hypothetical protein
VQVFNHVLQTYPARTASDASDLRLEFIEGVRRGAPLAIVDDNAGDIRQ